jgi:Ser/Thr protein kinase RdoA (MazF antagonist)
VPGPGGRFVAALPADSGGGWLRLYRWVDGVPVDPADAGVAARASGLLGRLHACAWPPRGEADPWYDTVPDPAIWDLHPDNVLADGSGELILFDWDDAGSASLGRELARLPGSVAGHVR